MKLIEIKTLTDDHDCDTCGTTYASGGIVYIDGRKILEKEPVAHCYGATYYDEADLLVLALAAVGVEVRVDDSRYDICCHDDEYHGKGESDE
jgi:5-keto 4-deoxyuronate isomerase